MKNNCTSKCKVDDKGNFLSDVVKARLEGDFPVVEPSKLT